MDSGLAAGPVALHSHTHRGQTAGSYQGDLESPHLGDPLGHLKLPVAVWRGREPLRLSRGNRGVERGEEEVQAALALRGSHWRRLAPPSGRHPLSVSAFTPCGPPKADFFYLFFFLRAF